MTSKLNQNILQEIKKKKKEKKIAHRIADYYGETPTDDRKVAGWGRYTRSCFHGCLQ